MDFVSLIVGIVVGILSLIPVYFFVKVKLRKRYKFDLDYKNITFATFSSPQNPKLDNRFCLILYVLRIVNRSDESNTLKNVLLSYKFNGKVFQDESFVVLTGTTPPEGKPALITSNGLDNIIMMGWDNIRPKLANCEVLQPGAVLSGSAVFLFDSCVNNLNLLKNLKLIISDYHGNKLSYPIAIREEWLKGLDKGFKLINKSFAISEDNTFKWK